MRNIWLVIKREIAVTAGRPAFWLSTFLFPLLIMAFSLLPQLMARDVSASATISLTQPPAALKAGYVDRAGIVRSLPAPLTGAMLRPFADEAAAHAALAAGEIDRYYIVPADVLDSGSLVAVDRQIALITGSEQAELMKYVIAYNLLGDAERARLVMNPAPSVVRESLAVRHVAADSTAGFALSFAVMFILFFTITMSASYMLQSVSKEKENRTAEVMLLSVRPLDLMVGKVVGLGAVALLQMAVWIAGGLLATRQLAGLGAAVAAALTPQFAAWAVAFFLFGYLTYAAGLAALGALAPNMREGAQYTFVLLLPLMIPLWANSVFLREPNGAAATAISLFPLTAPTAMVTRLVSGPVPVWQPAVALAGLAVAAYLFLRTAARLFRADTLLSHASLSWQQIARELRGGRSA